MKDGGSAFPVLTWGRDNATGNPAYFADEGMSLRDWFAGQALAMFPRLRGQEEFETAHTIRHELAEFAYAIADAMLAARESDNRKCENEEEDAPEDEQRLFDLACGEAYTQASS